MLMGEVGIRNDPGTEQIMWAIDLTHTAHSPAQTGIQQVCRGLREAFSRHRTGRAVVHDRFAGIWRTPDRLEEAFLNLGGSARPGRRRGARWSAWQQVRGRLWRITGTTDALKEAEGLLLPEIYDQERERSLDRCGLPRVAYFHDAVPFLHPAWASRSTRERFPDYLRSLARLTAVVCTSQTSEADLQVSWRRLGLTDLPPTHVVPLGLPLSRLPDASPLPAERANPLPVLLMIGSIEVRKNHLALLEAADSLWAKGLGFELRLVGMANRETGSAALERIAALQAAGRPLVWTGPLADQAVLRELQSADLFLCPSFYEGFGIPVLEALAHGLPCLVTEAGALAELIPGGGCLACQPTPASIGEGMERLLNDSDLCQRLQAEARQRPVRTLDDCYSDLFGILRQIGMPR